MSELVTTLFIEQPWLISCLIGLAGKCGKYIIDILFGLAYYCAVKCRRLHES